MKKTPQERADDAIVALIAHFKKNGAQRVPYTDLSKMIGWYDKNGAPVFRVGAVLGHMGDKIESADKHAPRIMALVVDKYDNLPRHGLQTFIENWNELSDSDKEKKVREQEKKVEQYVKQGKFDKILSKLGLQNDGSLESFSRPEDDDYEIAEHITVRKHMAGEREYRTRNPKIAQRVREKSDGICQCCGFNLRAVYGGLGSGCIECHHIKPVAKADDGEKNEEGDLVALCANCHRAIHVLLAQNKEKYKNNYRRSVSDLRKIIEKNQKLSKN